MPVARSTAGQTSYLGKVAAYREIIAHRVHKSHWGIPNLLVLTVTANESRIQEIIRRAQDGAGGGAAFLFKALGTPDITMPKPQLLFEPWLRPGIAPLRIDEER
jgi:hypothetical protein